MVGDVGAAPVAVLGTGTHAVLFHTLKIGGVVLVSYQVAPIVGDVGDEVPEEAGKVWPEAKLTTPLKVVVPLAFKEPLMMPEAGF